MPDNGQHFVAVVGGAISGSVAAEILADRGIRVAVIEQNKRPYGKIEDGLPRWHVEQRKQEYARIDARMKKPGVYFVPSTRLGRDVEFKDLCDNWGFSAVILANGAWRDRDLGVPGADEFVDKGLVYQNPFIYWYNHKNEKDYTGPRYETPDEALVVGGGLASIDVVKVLQLENYERAFREPRHSTSTCTSWKRASPPRARRTASTPESLGRERLPADLPPPRAGHASRAASRQRHARTDREDRAVRQKMLRLAQSRYLFRVQDRRLTTGLVVENGRVWLG